MNTCTELTIRLMPISELIPAPYNPRRAIKSSDPAYRKLAASLREFGLVEPLIWNELTGHVVGGHLRLSILRQQGAEQVPVSVVQLTPERERALNIVLNNREAQGQFDSAKLTEILGELEQQPELTLTGFDADDLRAFRLEPVEIPNDDLPADNVEILLTIPKEAYEAISPRLDAIVREFDLKCHVRGL
ncbi:MAG: ParB N-terminal domain-containing protein [Gemmataceae bacterium]